MRGTIVISIVGAVLCYSPLQVSATDIVSLDDLASQYTTPRTVTKLLKQQFTFTKDEDLFGVIERWQTPSEFVARRAGDCEDYALLARELLTRNGIESYVFSLFGTNGYAHTVCIYVDRHGRFNVINQDKIKRYKARTLEGLAARLCPTWSFGGITEQAGIRGRLLVEIRNNSHPKHTSHHSFDRVASTGTH
jgi:hypothetical protein